jgi:Protein of unknown function (DUF2878)
MHIKVINFIGFQLGWLACVLGGANGRPWLGVVLAVPILAWHFNKADSARKETYLLLAVAVIGGTFDQLLLTMEMVAYPAADWPSRLLPIWMCMLWVLFASTLNVSLRWMRGRLLVGSASGLLGGPVAYYAASRLGAVQLLHDGTLLIIGIAWAFWMPGMVWLSTRLDGYTGLDEPATGPAHV